MSDVWPNEPPLDDDEFILGIKNDPDLESRFIITPHIAYYSEQSLIECREKGAKNLLNLLKMVKAKTSFNLFFKLLIVNNRTQIYLYHLIHLINYYFKTFNFFIFFFY